MPARPDAIDHQPIYTNLARFHLINTYISAILVYAAVGIPFGTFLMTSFFEGLPDEIVNAALCDDLGDLGCFWRAALRIAKPGLAAIVVFQFILIWNDLLIGLLLLQTPQLRTITVGLGVLVSGNNTTLPLADDCIRSECHTGRHCLRPLPALPDCGPGRQRKQMKGLRWRWPRLEG